MSPRGPAKKKKTKKKRNERGGEDNDAFHNTICSWYVILRGTKDRSWFTKKSQFGKNSEKIRKILNIIVV